jgi:twinkle protein
MNAKEVSQLLAKDATNIAMMLLPNGKKESGRWVCGSIDGEAGKSLKVELSGHKAGRWADYSDKDMSGDMLDLWRLTKCISAKEAFKDACE